MNILFLCPPPTHYRDDSLIISSSIPKYFKEHKVIVQYSETDIYKSLINEKIDIIYASYERYAPVASKYSKLLNAPTIGHYEWIPPWRVGQESGNIWGNELIPINEMQKNMIILDHKQNLKYWKKMNTKTTSSTYALETIEKFSGEVFCDVKKRPMCCDTDYLNSFKKENVEEQYQILSTARFAPQKRLHHVIVALSFLKNPPKYKIIGYGDNDRYLKTLAQKYNIDLELVGKGQNGKKVTHIQESMFSVNIWATIPIVESQLFKKPAITYYHPHMYELHKNSPIYVENNNIKKLAEKIQYLIDNENERKQLGQNGYELFIGNKTGTYTLKETILRLNKLFEDTINGK